MMNNLPRRMDQFGNKLSALMSLKRLKMVLRFHFLPSYLHLAYDELHAANSDNLMILEHLHTLLQNYVSNNPSDRETYSSRFNIQDLWHQVPDPTERYTDILLRGLAYESHSEKLSVRHSVVSVLRLLEKRSPTSVYSVLQVR